MAGKGSQQGCAVEDFWQYQPAPDCWSKAKRAHEEEGGGERTFKQGRLEARGKVQVKREQLDWEAEG